ncbi:glycine cleavage system protein GcvH [Haloechinothrix sp. LS1_15]|uniref:glycine cleavage system protein GcvH n=1 Tax=Haloechinothrix sp. LS1_15 TaxID=2652248 RepID=UPI0029487A6B|nr:glycine cleavage system protein GcvH [Haloechinothrix sp. LS1_15]MDV6014620.1 glycine cleavage system protein GcvH [Haloechinothrix sp. LS1_15]
MSVPEELHYTEEHEWVETRDSGVVRVGITEYAQQQLGDVVFVDLPEVGKTLSSGEVFGEVESTKSVSELFAPVAGEVTAINEAVSDSPDLINEDPYGTGWLIEITPSDQSSIDGLLNADSYAQLISE